MKKFVFRLQVVLERARAEEDAQLRQLAELQRLSALKQQEIARKQEERRLLIAKMADLQREAIDPRELHSCHLRLEIFANEQALLLQELAELEQRITDQQQVVIAAMRKRQTLERLHEKKWLDYRKEVERYELQVMEEAMLPRLAHEYADRHLPPEA